MTPAFPPPAALLPHAGAMVLLDEVLAWDAGAVCCSATSHRDPANPLRRAGVLPAICGAEYALQAAAVHGALGRPDRRVPQGYVAVLRDVELHVPRLDESGPLHAIARLVREESGGVIYDLELRSADGAVLLRGRAVIAWPKP